VFSLTKKELRVRLVEESARVKWLEKEIELYRKELLEAYRDQGARLDNLLDVLKPKEQVKIDKNSEFKPIRHVREPWSRIQARQEAKHKQEYWEKKQKELESDIAQLEKQIDERNRK
jgi:hypothetical protein